MTSLKTSIKTITYLSDTGCLEIQGASLPISFTVIRSSEHGGERGVLLYSLIGTCKLNDEDPENYLRHVSGVIADWPVNRVSELLPWRIVLPAE